MLKNSATELYIFRKWIPQDLKNDVWTTYHLNKIIRKSFSKIQLEGYPLILDAGCGYGAEASYLSKYGEVVGIDLSKNAIRTAKKEYPQSQFVLGSAIKLPFKENSFQITFSKDVLHHTPNRIGILSEMKRVTSTDGYIVVLESNAINPVHKYYFRGKHKEEAGLCKNTESNLLQELRTVGISNVNSVFIDAHTYYLWFGGWHKKKIVKFLPPFLFLNGMTFMWMFVVNRIPSFMLLVFRMENIVESSLRLRIYASFICLIGHK